MAKKTAAPAKSAVKEVEGSAQEVTMLDPNLLLGDQNTRFGLKKSRIDAMKESIIEKGGVMQAIEVEPLNEEDMEANEGKEYRLVFGHYRLAGMLAANAEGHNFQMPCVITDINDPVIRMKRQLAENLDRENQSPIDKATAIQSLLDAGVTKMEVRNIFATPGGRKGLKIQPASNSFINMTLSFLGLSKKIQTMIHEGEIGVQDAYWLTKQPEDKRELAVEKAVANRLKELEGAEEEENKFLEEEKKHAEAEAKRKEAGKALETAKAEVDAGVNKLKEIADKNLELFKAKMAAKGEAKKEADAALKEAEKLSREAEMELAKKRKELDKQQEKADKQAKDAEERAAKLKAARDAAAKAKPAKESKPLQVKKSDAITQNERPNVVGISLKAGAIVKVFKDLSLGGGPYPKVAGIAKVVVAVCTGHILSRDIMPSLAVFTGENKDAKTVATVTEFVKEKVKKTA